MCKPLSSEHILDFLFVFLSLAFIGLLIINLSLANPWVAGVTGTPSSSCTPEDQLRAKLDNPAYVGTSPSRSIPAKRKQLIRFLQSIGDLTPSF